MAKTGEDFLAATSTLSMSGTPTGASASIGTIDTPDTLPPLWPEVALSEVRALPFAADQEVSESDESTWAGTQGEGISSQRCLRRGATQEPVYNSGQSTATAALDATGGGELGHGAQTGQPEEPPTKAVLLERTTTIFLHGKGVLRASGGRALRSRS